MMRHGWPVARAGMTVGLLGGSFDPAHEGHRHITLNALQRLGLDRVWWLVSPGNPLKARGPAPMPVRLAAARALMQHPQVEITDIEADMGTRHTARTLERLCALYPGVHFVWLMGADNLAGLHLWQDWRSIMGRVPVAVFARPGAGLPALSSKAAHRFGGSRVTAEGLRGFGRHAPPAWAFVNMPLRDVSSTELRARGASDLAWLGQATLSTCR
jgi:nicotinate-nucleotide adenylyltransferase